MSVIFLIEVCQKQWVRKTAWQFDVEEIITEADQNTCNRSVRCGRDGRRTSDYDEPPRRRNHSYLNRKTVASSACDPGTRSPHRIPGHTGFGSCPHYCGCAARLETVRSVFGKNALICSIYYFYIYWSSD